PLSLPRRRLAVPAPPARGFGEPDEYRHVTCSCRPMSAGDLGFPRDFGRTRLRNPRRATACRVDTTAGPADPALRFPVSLVKRPRRLAMICRRVLPMTGTRKVLFSSLVVASAVWALTASGQAESQQPTVQIPNPGVPQIMTLEGKFVRVAYNNEGYVIL